MGLAELEELLSKPKRAPCGVTGCEKPRKKNGLCTGHDYRRRNGLPLDPPIREYRLGGGPCGIAGCPKHARTRGLCAAHYCRQLEGRPDWDQKLRPVGEPTAYLGTPSIRVEVLDLLDRQAATLRVHRLDLVRSILNQWARDVTTKRRENLLDGTGPKRVR